MKPNITLKHATADLDKQIGARVRQARLSVGASQEALGEGLGVTFQQIQKYEKGTNRVGSGTLFRIAAILGKPIGFFYEGLGTPETLARDADLAEVDPEILRNLASLKGTAFLPAIRATIAAAAEGRA